MLALLDRTTFLVLGSALAMAVLCLMPEAVGHFFLLWIAASGLHIADVLFHELGHTLFAWLFGKPAIPMIFTLFGADQAGGMSMQWERRWVLQILAFGGLGYGCYWAQEHMRWLFKPMLGLSGFVVLVAFSGKTEMVISYMGHGSAILMGGFFFMRAWLGLDARHEFERWLNALLGFFLILHNAVFAYGLIFQAEAHAAYTEHVAFGITHNDFVKVAEAIPGGSVQGVAWFTLALAACVLMGAGFVAAWLQDDFYEV